MEFIEKIAIGKQPTEQEIASELYEICEREHSSCNDACPVFRLNGHKVLNNSPKPFHENRGCDCFKNGTAMLNFIRSHHKSLG